MTNTSRPAAAARWALQDAKNRFSEVVDAALSGRPQIVTRRGVETAVVISHAEFTRMTATRSKRHPSLASYLVDGPVLEGGDAFERIQLHPRGRA